MKKYGVREIRPTITDIGATDNVPGGMSGDVREGYLAFCQHHPGFDDEALMRRRRARRLESKSRREVRP